jgi:hypothetical protein
LSTLRILGVAAGVAVIISSFRSRRRRQLTRGELLVWLGVGATLSLVSLVPAVAAWANSLLRLSNRVEALLVVAVVMLMALRLRDLGKVNRLQDTVRLLVRNLAVRDARNFEAFPSADLGVIAIVIAAYNEEEALGGVLDELPSELEGYRVEPIVVVDGGDDDTEEVARSAGYIVVAHSVNRGHGDALRTGCNVALRRGASIIVTMDADGQHRPADLPQLVKPIIAGEADHVQGSRFLGDYEEAGSLRHRGITFFTWLINVMTRANITDSTIGFRAIRAESLALLRLEEETFPVAELIVESLNRGIAIHEVPVSVLSRSHGESKKPPSLRYPIGFLTTVAKTWLR